MSNFDDLFDKSYAERMRAQTDQDFSEQDWGALSGRLDAAERKRHRLFPIWITGLLGGLLLLSNLVWFFAFDHFKKEVRQSNLAILGHRDTIFETILEHRTDTIYINTTTTIREKPASFSTNNVVGEKYFRLETVTDSTILTELERRITAEGIPNFFEKNGPSKFAFLENQTTKISDLLVGKSAQAGPKILPIHLQGIETRAFQPLILGKIRLPSTGRFELPTVEKSNPKARFFKNDWWMASASGGWLIPISSDLTRKNGFSVGGQLEYGFKPNQSIWIDLSRTSLTCAGDKTETYGIDIPYKHNYKVAYFETTNGPKVSNRVGLGLRFRQDEGKKRARIGLGLGYVLEYQDAFDLMLEWENLIDPNDRQTESINIPKEHYAIGYLHADLGIEWRMGRSWISSVSIWKEAKGNFKHGLPGYFGIKGGLGYRF